MKTSKMKFLLIITILTFGSITYPQNSVKLNLIVISHLANDSSGVFITGNSPVIGNWNPKFYKMDAVNDSTWQSQINLPVNTTLEFKFTLGDWNREALNSDKTVTHNNSIKVISDTTVVYHISYWSNKRENKFRGQITGNVEYQRGFYGNGIIPRDIIVWLPPGYNVDLEKRYPVLYMQDGQNIIDPQTSAFGVDWQMDENADTLIKKGFIEPIIIVGIYNTRLRESEYGFNDTSSAYKKFIVNDLKPFIDSHYRTKTGTESNAIAGSSLGGLIAFELAWEFPDVFSKCACVSPAFDIEQYNYIPFVQNTDSVKKQTQIYIDVGGHGIDTLLQSGVDEMISVLKQKGFDEGENLYYKFYPEATHSEKDWAARVWRILIYLFGTEKGKRLL